MGRSSHQPLSRDRAWSCVSLNFSISGLGTLKAGRLFAGVGQVIFNLAGLVLIGAWMFQWVHRICQAQLGETHPVTPDGWLWKCGAVSIGISWTWMLLTCASLMREAKAAEESASPPRLSEVPPKLPRKPK